MGYWENGHEAVYRKIYTTLPVFKLQVQEAFQARTHGTQFASKGPPMFYLMLGLCSSCESSDTLLPCRWPPKKRDSIVWYSLSGVGMAPSELPIDQQMSSCSFGCLPLDMKSKLFTKRFWIHFFRVLRDLLKNVLLQRMQTFCIGRDLDAPTRKMQHCFKKPWCLQTQPPHNLNSMFNSCTT